MRRIVRSVDGRAVRCCFGSGIRPSFGGRIARDFYCRSNFRFNFLRQRDCECRQDQEPGSTLAAHHFSEQKARDWQVAYQDVESFSALRVDNVCDTRRCTGRRYRV